MSIEDYHKGFCDGMSIDTHYPQTLSIMGYSLDDIMELIRKNQMPTKHIMTRAEVAVMLRDKVFGITDTGQAMKWADFFIDTGMLEIKEKEMPNYLMIKDMDGDIQKVDIAELILKLSFAGFEVKKK